MASAMFNLSAGTPAGKMFRGMIGLSLGSIAGRVIGIIFIPLLTRLYTPADYGLLSVYNSLVQIIFPLLTLRYLVAVPLPRRDETALAVFTLSLLIMVAMSLALGVALFLGGSGVFSMLSAEALGPWWWLLLISAPVIAGSELVMSWATRRRAYRLMARNTVIISALGETLKLALGLLGLKPFGLLLGQMVGQSGGVVSFTHAFFADFRKIPRVVTWSRLKFVALYYGSYPVFRLPSQFLLVFAMQAPLLYTAKLYDVATAGQLGLALMALALPIRLIGDAMGKAYYAEIARLGRTRVEEIIVLTRAMQTRLLLLGVVPTIVLMIFGPSLFSIAFGEDWVSAGYYASILSVYIYVQFTSAPLLNLFNVFGRQSVYLAINGLRVFIILVMFWCVDRFSVSSDEYVITYGVIMAVFYAAVTVYVFRMMYRLRRGAPSPGGSSR